MSCLVASVRSPCWTSCSPARGQSVGQCDLVRFERDGIRVLADGIREGLNRSAGDRLQVVRRGRGRGDSLTDAREDVAAADGRARRSGRSRWSRTRWRRPPATTGRRRGSTRRRWRGGSTTTTTRSGPPAGAPVGGGAGARAGLGRGVPPVLGAVGAAVDGAVGAPVGSVVGTARAFGTGPGVGGAGGGTSGGVAPAAAARASARACASATYFSAMAWYHRLGSLGPSGCGGRRGLPAEVSDRLLDRTHFRGDV